MSFLSNRLQYETSPYLLQHAQNPVDWYPWGREAFQKAREEDKPIFLSIGYSSCHWCHVMAHESFEDEKTSGLLNRYFICIKVDKEERPDIDSIYMAVCQAFTGSGGWPTSIFMDAGQRPFFAGTYFPKESWGGMTGFRELLQLIHEQWVYNRPALISRAKQLVAQLRQDGRKTGQADTGLLETAAASYRRIYDPKNGGFGRAPKFPAPHQLLFLLSYYERRGDAACLQMAEQTLLQLYRGGLCDHIGSGFCRYSTDDRFLVPHFEKMLYDNALLILAYCKAYALTKKPLYLLVAERTAGFILREMASPSGGFYSAQDADSGGEEGKYYLFTPQEIIRLLGREDGKAFCRHFGISEGGNFEGKSIPNLLGSDPMDRSFDKFLEPVRQYRRQRCPLQLDDKILTAWNALMMAALCRLYQLSQNRIYWEAAKRADRFIQENLYEDGALFVSLRAGKRGKKGFLDDYAAYLFAQLALYEASLDQSYLSRAKRLCADVFSRFQDPAGGFYLYGGDSEPLILRPKETYDGALPSGNSLMAWDLVRLSLLFPHESYGEKAKRQLDFLVTDAMQYPPGYAMFLLALLDSSSPPPKVTAILAQRADADRLPLLLPPDTVTSLLDKPEEGFPLKDGRTTFYICKNHSCLPPVNDLKGLL